MLPTAPLWRKARDLPTKAGSLLGGILASGTYDLSFTLFDNNGTNSGLIAGPISTNAVGVTNGLFTVTLDFGANYPGANRWLAIGVRTNGGATFTPLSPLQQLTPAPYAIYAGVAGNLNGTVSLAQLPAAVLTNNETGIVLSGAFTGNGTGLTNVNATALNGLNASNFWQTSGNSGTSPANNFFGTKDNQALEMRVNGARALRLEPNTNGAPNVIGGSPANFVASGVVGAVIGGGGATNVSGQVITNSVTANFGTVGGGQGNVVSGLAAMVPGGKSNIASGNFSFAAGANAQATNQGAFVWADAQGTSFVSTNTNSFNVRANGGVVFSTSGAGVSVDGVSVLTATPGAIQGYQINDGGSSAYQAFQQAVQGVGGDSSLTFSNIFPVTATNQSTPSFVLTVNGTALGTVVGFAGHEAISEPYSYVVEVLNPSATINPDSEIGLTGSLNFTRNGHSTSFGGIVTACSLASSDGTNFLYTVRLESPLAYLALTTDYNMAQLKSVPVEAATVYAAASSSAPLAQNLASTYVTHESLTQFGETDLNFFSRLLESEGIFYFFNQSASPPSIILSDNTAAYLASPISSYPYYGDTSTNIPAGAEYIRTFQKAFHQSTLKSTVNAFDLTHSTTTPIASATAAEGVGENYEFGNQVATTTYDQQVATARQDLQTEQRAVSTGSSIAPDLRAGYKFTVSDSSGAGLAGTYLVTSVRHAGFIRVTNGASTFLYGNQFEAIPASVNFRPALKTPKPHAQPCTAVVSVTPGEEIFTDQYGRVKVLFHWDRVHSNNGSSSAFIPVASPMAGAGRGMIFIPRVGDEVLVSFLEGDPDQPLITGSLFTSANTPPFTLPGNKTQSGIVTLSSKGGGGNNILRFEDKTGSEEIFIQAQRDMNMDILNNMTQTVQADMTVNVTHNLSLTGGNQVSLNGPLSITGTATLGGLLTANGGAQFLGGAVSVNTGAAVEGSLTVNTNIYMMDHPIYLRGRTGLDHNHGLAYCGTGATNFAPGVLPDGPVLWGFNGGALGIENGGARAVLAWTNGGVAITGNLTASASATGGFGSAIADIENNDTTANSSPALRVVAHGSPTFGALSVSTQGPVSSTNTNNIISFGNASAFVSWLDNNGNWFAKGNFNANTFVNLCDRNAKENFQEVSTAAVLEKVAALPLRRWNYKEDKTTEHIGPMAQDFHAAFKVGADDRHIATVDEEGVALAAIQGLNQKLEQTRQMVKEKDAKIQALEKRMADLEKMVAQLARLNLETGGKR